MIDAEQRRVEDLMLIAYLRNSTAEPILELDLSINDWIDRVKGAIKDAHGAARAGMTDVEREQWARAASYCLGRMEQIGVLMAQAECEHAWPAALEPASKCPECGLMYGEWSV